MERVAEPRGLGTVKRQQAYVCIFIEHDSAFFVSRSCGAMAARFFPARKVEKVVRSSRT